MFAVNGWGRDRRGAGEELKFVYPEMSRCCSVGGSVPAASAASRSALRPVSPEGPRPRSSLETCLTPLLRNDCSAPASTLEIFVLYLQTDVEICLKLEGYLKSIISSTSPAFTKIIFP